MPSASLPPVARVALLCLVGLSACGNPLAPRSAPAAASAETETAHTASTPVESRDVGPLEAFARVHRDEVERLGLPTNIYLSREQIHPKGFVALEKRRRGPESADHSLTAGTETAKMFAFDFADPAYGECGQAITSGGTLCDTVVFPGVALTAEQRDRAQEVARLQGTAPNGAPAARCFEPHHAIVFFDSKGVPVSEACPVS